MNSFKERMKKQITQKLADIDNENTVIDINDILTKKSKLSEPSLSEIRKVSIRNNNNLLKKQFTMVSEQSPDNSVDKFNEFEDDKLLDNLREKQIVKKNNKQPNTKQRLEILFDKDPIKIQRKIRLQAWDLSNRKASVDTIDDVLIKRKGSLESSSEQSNSNEMNIKIVEKEDNKNDDNKIKKFNSLPSNVNSRRSSFINNIPDQSSNIRRKTIGDHEIILNNIKNPEKMKRRISHILEMNPDMIENAEKIPPSQRMSELDEIDMLRIRSEFNKFKISEAVQKNLDEYLGIDQKVNQKFSNVMKNQFLSLNEDSTQKRVFKQIKISQIQKNRPHEKFDMYCVVKQFKDFEILDILRQQQNDEELYSQTQNYRTIIRSKNSNKYEGMMKKKINSENTKQYNVDELKLNSGFNHLFIRSDLICNKFHRKVQIINNIEHTEHVKDYLTNAQPEKKIEYWKNLGQNEKSTVLELDHRYQNYNFVRQFYKNQTRIVNVRKRELELELLQLSLKFESTAQTKAKKFLQRMITEPNSLVQQVYNLDGDPIHENRFERIRLVFWDFYELIRFCTLRRKFICNWVWKKIKQRVDGIGVKQVVEKESATKIEMNKEFMFTRNVVKMLNFIKQFKILKLVIKFVDKIKAVTHQNKEIRYLSHMFKYPLLHTMQYESKSKKFNFEGERVQPDDNMARKMYQLQASKFVDATNMFTDAYFARQREHKLELIQKVQNQIDTNKKKYSNIDEKVRQYQEAIETQKDTTKISKLIFKEPKDNVYNSNKLQQNETGIQTNFNNINNRNQEELASNEQINEHQLTQQNYYKNEDDTEYEVYNDDDINSNQYDNNNEYDQNKLVKSSHNIEYDHNNQNDLIRIETKTLHPIHQDNGSKFTQTAYTIMDNSNFGNELIDSQGIKYANLKLSLNPEEEKMIYRKDIKNIIIKDQHTNRQVSPKNRIKLLPEIVESPRRKFVEREKEKEKEILFKYKIPPKLRTSKSFDRIEDVEHIITNQITGKPNFNSQNKNYSNIIYTKQKQYNKTISNTDNSELNIKTDFSTHPSQMSSRLATDTDIQNHSIINFNKSAKLLSSKIKNQPKENKYKNERIDISNLEKRFIDFNQKMTPLPISNYKQTQSKPTSSGISTTASVLDSQLAENQKIDIYNLNSKINKRKMGQVRMESVSAILKSEKIQPHLKRKKDVDEFEKESNMAHQAPSLVTLPLLNKVPTKTNSKIEQQSDYDDRSNYTSKLQYYTKLSENEDFDLEVNADAVHYPLDFWNKQDLNLDDIDNMISNVKKINADIREAKLKNKEYLKNAQLIDQNKQIYYGIKKREKKKTMNQNQLKHLALDFGGKNKKKKKKLQTQGSTISENLDNPVDLKSAQVTLMNNDTSNWYNEDDNEANDGEVIIEKEENIQDKQDQDILNQANETVQSNKEKTAISLPQTLQTESVSDFIKKTFNNESAVKDKLSKGLGSHIEKTDSVKASPKDKKKTKIKPKGPNDLVEILNDINNFGYSKIKLMTTQVNDLKNLQEFRHIIIRSTESYHQENKHIFFNNSSNNKTNNDSKLFPKFCKKLPQKYTKIENILTTLGEYFKKIVTEICRTLDQVLDKKNAFQIEKSSLTLCRPFCYDDFYDDNWEPFGQECSVFSIMFSEKQFNEGMDQYKIDDEAGFYIHREETKELISLEMNEVLIYPGALCALLQNVPPSIRVIKQHENPNMNMQHVGMFIDQVPDLKAKLTHMLEFEIEDEHLLQPEHKMAAWGLSGKRFEEVLEKQQDSIQVQLTGNEPKD